MLLITGATGFLGSALVNLLVCVGKPVRAVVRYTSRAAALLPDGVELAVADVENQAALERAARGCTAIVHLAGSVGDSPYMTRRANVEGTRRVLAAARAAGVARVVYTSSSAAVM